MKYFISDKYGNCLADNKEAANQKVANAILSSLYTEEEIEQNEIEILSYDDSDYELTF